MILCVTDYCPFFLRCVLALREKGIDVGLVDFAIHPFFERFAAVEAFRAVEFPPGLDRLQAWLETMRARSAVRSVARPREHSIDFFREFYAD